MSNLLSCDQDSGQVYVHSGISATITNSYDSPSTGPRGLTMDSIGGC